MKQIVSFLELTKTSYYPTDDIFDDLYFYFNIKKEDTVPFQLNEFITPIQVPKDWNMIKNAEIYQKIFSTFNIYSLNYYSTLLIMKINEDIQTEQLYRIFRIQKGGYCFLKIMYNDVFYILKFHNYHEINIINHDMDDMELIFENGVFIKSYVEIQNETLVLKQYNLKLIEKLEDIQNNTVLDIYNQNPNISNNNIILNAMINSNINKNPDYLIIKRTKEYNDILITHYEINYNNTTLMLKTMAGGMVSVAKGLNNISDALIYAGNIISQSIEQTGNDISQSLNNISGSITFLAKETCRGNIKIANSNYKTAQIMSESIIESGRLSGLGAAIGGQNVANAIKDVCGYVDGMQTW